MQPSLTLFDPSLFGHDPMDSSYCSGVKRTSGVPLVSSPKKEGRSDGKEEENGRERPNWIRSSRDTVENKKYQTIDKVVILFMCE